MINRYKIQSCGKTILFQTYDKDVIDYLLNDPLPLNHIPCYKINPAKDNATESEQLFTFVHQLGHEVNLSYDSTKLKMVLTSTGKIPGGQFIFAFLPIFEHLYELEGLYGLHAGLVILNEHAVFLIGDTKTGKSTISAKLHYDFGADFVADEKSIISLAKGQIYTGSSILSLRDSAIKNAKIKNIEIYRLSNSKSTSKNYYRPKNNLSYPIDIKKALFVFPHFGNVELTVETPNDFILTYMLYENITATIRSCISVFVSESVGMPSMDNENLSTKRALNFRNYLSKIPHKCLDVTGNFDEICNYILSETLKR